MTCFQSTNNIILTTQCDVIVVIKNNFKIWKHKNQMCLRVRVWDRRQKHEKSHENNTVDFEKDQPVFRCSGRNNNGKAESPTH